ncbi:sce7726 family protein [Lactococcus garvieae]|nr:sce7726 family protein [Lactococcus garvieae]
MNNNFILNRVFSQKTIKDLLLNNKSEVLEKAYKKFVNDDLNIDNGAKFQALYKVLEKSYRNEYYYKNTLLNKLLLGRHSLNTTTALAELSINNSKADFVLLNGKAVVYEIKTELDTLNRVENQVIDYYKVFKNVEIVTNETHLDKVLKLYSDTEVGVSIITKRKTIKNIKKAEPVSRYLDYSSIYKMLRKTERFNILQSYYDDLPSVDSFSEFKRYFQLFEAIPISNVYDSMIIELKKRSDSVKQNSEQFSKVPYELKSLLYFGNMPNRVYDKFQKTLKE